MFRFSIFSIFRFLVFGSAMIILLSQPTFAQTDSITKWKPNIGDRFECTVTDYSSCGDFMCQGLDTIVFEIVDTSFDADNQHTSAVLAATSAIGLHLYYYAWGRGWDSSEVAHSYGDSTLIALTGKQQIETTFDGYNVEARSWTQIPLIPDSSVVFQGSRYTAFSGASTMDAAFLPELGWFYSIFSYISYGPCFSPCIEETLTMSLISASTSHSSVQSQNASNFQLTLSWPLLELLNVEATHVSLMDILGQKVNEWQFPLSGPRDISLNVADVPNGIYFLRVSGTGVDEVKKVMIAH